MKALQHLLLALLVSCFAVGCASIVSGTSQNVSFQSTPEGATVAVNGRVLGKTPVSATLKKEKNQSVTFTLDGHKPVTVPMTTKLDNWFWGNILIGGVLGSTTDAATGAVNQYAPDKYYATLTPEGKGTDGKTGRSQYHQIRDFVVLQHDGLVRELALGRADGERFSSLAMLLRIDEAGRQAAFEDIGKMSRQRADAVAFADAILGHYAIPR